MHVHHMYISSNVPSLSVLIVGSVGGGYASTGERRGMSGQGKEDKFSLTGQCLHTFSYG